MLRSTRCAPTQAEAFWIVCIRCLRKADLSVIQMMLEQRNHQHPLSMQSHAYANMPTSHRGGWFCPIASMLFVANLSASLPSAGCMHFKLRSHGAPIMRLCARQSIMPLLGVSLSCPAVMLCYHTLASEYQTPCPPQGACGAWVQRTRRAMTLVGIPKAEQDAIFASVAAVLHLGNIDFAPTANSEASQPLDDSARAHLAAAAVLLGVKPEGLGHALTTRTRHTVDGESPCFSIPWLLLTCRVGRAAKLCLKCRRCLSIFPACMACDEWLALFCTCPSFHTQGPVILGSLHPCLHALLLCLFIQHDSMIANMHFSCRAYCQPLGYQGIRGEQGCAGQDDLCSCV